MVHPGGAVALLLTLCLVGTAVALIHFAAYPEFGGTVFGKVMGKSLPVKPCPEAVLPYKTAVGAHSFQVLINVYRIYHKDISP